jgi:hypothetical protein
MRNSLIILGLFGLFALNSVDTIAQNQIVKYYYDGNGNRYLRETISITLLPDSVNLPDTTTKYVLEEDIIPDNNTGQKTNIGNCEISVFPNPFESSFNVEIDGIAYEQNAKLMLYSMNGSQIKQLENLQQTSTINASSLTSGTYFLTIYIKDEKATWKLIKR